MLKLLRLIPLLLLPHAAFSADTPADWSFIESVGGMAVGAPQADEAVGWLLPLECDLTGLRHISVDPTALNSSRVIERVDWEIEARTLLISLFLEPSSYATDAARCPPLLLKDVKAGDYDVKYRDATRSVPLGKVRLRR